MAAPDERLTTMQMADFVADGYLRFDAIVPDAINRRVLAELPAIEDEKLRSLLGGDATDTGPATSTPLSQCYTNSALGEFLTLPAIQGVISSLVGSEPVFDHDFVHHLGAGSQYRQHLHPDAIVDTDDPAFDIQLFYFPHDVAPGGGGTRFVPGTHLRRVTASATARYQHVVGEQRFAGPAGTVLVFHHGLWHAGDANPSSVDRWMYKIRLNPVEPQVRLWNLSDLDRHQNDHTDHVFARSRLDSVADALRRRHPWQSIDANRYDLVERTRLWRHLSDDPSFDADYYLTRHEQRARNATPATSAASDAYGG